jgi:hypothetical protein
MTTPARPSPVIGDLNLQLEDGTILTAGTDVALARQWAEHLHGPEGWKQLTATQQAATVADALRELRVAYAAAGIE